MGKIRIFTAERVLVGSFLIAIVVGCVLLMLPGMAPGDAEDVSFLDGLFTATSATCVTGLIVRDTGGDYTFGGQLVILILIQLGGLGIITFTNIMIVLRRGRLSLIQRQLQEESTGLLPQLPARTVLKRVFVFTFTFEIIGAIILAARFWSAYEQDFSTALWNGVFHSVSAFCNAGFALFPDSFMGYRDDIVITSTLMMLIIAGGIGFVIFADLGRVFRLRIKGERKRMAFHTKVVLWTTLFLLLFGALVFYTLENRGVTMQGHGFFGRWLDAFFQSVTCRTAGFNTIDTSDLTNASLIISMFLMVVGASPGSAGGGIKTTTFAVIVALIVSRTRTKKGVQLFGRCTKSEAVSKALATGGGFLLLIFFATTLLQITELPTGAGGTFRGQFIELLFETVSAAGTVGLSTGITDQLSGLGRVIIICCMFAGRLGPVLVATSLIGQKRKADYSLAEEPLIIG